MLSTIADQIKFGPDSTDELLVPEGDSVSDISLEIGHFHQIADIFFIEWQSFFAVWVKEMENRLPVEFGKQRLMAVEIIVVAAPAIFLGKSADLGPDRIEVDVAGEKKSVRGIINDDRTKPTLKNVPCDFMLGLKPVGKARVEVMDTRGEIGLTHLQVEVIVVEHETKSIAIKTEFSQGLS